MSCPTSQAPKPALNSKVPHNVAGKMFDLDVPFFLPVWRRVAVLVVAIGWGLFEISTGAIFWGIIFIGIGCIAAWKFRIADWDAVAKEAEEG